MGKLDELFQLGQSVWLDFIRRSLITSGELQALVYNGVRGITSNPTIFEKAIAGNTDYDEAIKTLATSGANAEKIYESLTLQDISQTADIFRPVWEASEGLDGYVSLEVNPKLAHDTKGTVLEAKRLFAELNRPNIMIKVPATPEGLPAITELIGSGVNVNVTLLFGLENYRQNAEAYISGLERLLADGKDVSKIASVASVFVSRIDNAVDKALENIGNSELLGKIAVANSKVIYQAFTKIFAGERWEKLEAAGARVQRVLWASTSTKNPNYPDTLYVDELIGPNTVNTLPPATLEAFLDHGKVAVTLTNGVDEARKNIEMLAKLGIDFDEITDQLQKDGVDAFTRSFENLLRAIDEKRKSFI